VLAIRVDPLYSFCNPKNSPTPLLTLSQKTQEKTHTHKIYTLNIVKAIYRKIMYDYEMVKAEVRTPNGAALTVVRTAPGGMRANAFIDLG
jgi:archaellin